MATEASQPLKVSVPASADLVGSTGAGQFRFVKISGTASSSHYAVGQAVLAGAGDHNILGVSQDKPTRAGQAISVVVIGVTKVVAVGGITAGATLGPDASGLAQAVTVTGSTYTKSSVGLLLANSDAAASDYARAVVNCLSPLAGT